MPSLEKPLGRILEWPLDTQGRRHVHSRIDITGVPVSHETHRQGSPSSLVLTKQQSTVDDGRASRARDEADLQWLSANWPDTAG